MNLGCKEKAQKPQENLGFASLGEAKDYLYFKTGSWWVYKNSYTNELDTMILTYCQLDTFHAENSLRKVDYELISFTIQSLRDNAIYVTNSYDWDIDLPSFRQAWTIECRRNGGFYNNYYGVGSLISNQFYFPFDKSGRLAGVAKTLFESHVDSLVIEGKVYRDIVKFSVEYDGTYPFPNRYISDNGHSVYFWSKNYGLIRIEHDSWDAPNNGNKVHMVWDLIESHIIP